MTLEQSILLELVASAITKKPVQMPDAAENADWRLVMKEAAWQAVLLLAVDAAAKIPDVFTKENYPQEYRRTYTSLVSCAKVEKSQKDLIDLLIAHNKPYVILKGTACAAYYPNPELRSLGDVDFLIAPNDRNEIETLLLDAGYKREQENHDCHTVFRKPDAHLEMHYKVAGIPNGEIGEKVSAFLESIFLNPVLRQTKLGAFNAPQDVLHGLIILLHMQHHMLGEGLGLRHLCDWACFVQKTGGMDFWNDALLPFLKEIGLFKYAAAMTKTAAQYLKIDCPEWAKAVSDSLCEEVIEDILAGGNFGKKDEARAKSGMMVSNRGKDGTKHSKLYYVCSTLATSVRMHHPIVKRIPPLFAVFFVARATRYLWRTLIGKRPSFAKMLPKAQERQSLYKQLHIFEVES